MGIVSINKQNTYNIIEFSYDILNFSMIDNHI